MLHVEWWFSKQVFGEWQEELIMYDSRLTMPDAIALFDPFQDRS